MRYFTHSFILVLFVVSLEATEKLFVACEGNYYEPGSGSLAIIDDFGNLRLRLKTFRLRLETSRSEMLI